MFAILLDAVFQPLHKIGQLTSHHLNIDCSHFISLSNGLLLWEFTQDYTYFHKKKSQVLKSGNFGGHGMSPKCKISFPENICVYANMRCSTVHCFIRLLKWHKIPRKIIGFLPFSLWPLQANWYLFKNIRFPKLLLVCCSIINMNSGQVWYMNQWLDKVNY